MNTGTINPPSHQKKASGVPNSKAFFNDKRIKRQHLSLDVYRPPRGLSIKTRPWSIFSYLAKLRRFWMVDRNNTKGFIINKKVSNAPTPEGHLAKASLKSKTFSESNLKLFPLTIQKSACSPLFFSTKQPVASTLSPKLKWRLHISFSVAETWSYILLLSILTSLPCIYKRHATFALFCLELYD